MDDVDDGRHLAVPPGPLDDPVLLLELPCRLETLPGQLPQLLRISKDTIQQVVDLLERLHLHAGVAPSVEEPSLHHCGVDLVVSAGILDGIPARVQLHRSGDPLERTGFGAVALRLFPLVTKRDVPSFVHGFLDSGRDRDPDKPGVLGGQPRQRRALASEGTAGEAPGHVGEGLRIEHHELVAQGLVEGHLDHDESSGRDGNLRQLNRAAGLRRVDELHGVSTALLLGLPVDEVGVVFALEGDPVLPILHCQHLVRVDAHGLARFRNHLVEHALEPLEVSGVSKHLQLVEVAGEGPLEEVHEERSGDPSHVAHLTLHLLDGGQKPLHCTSSEGCSVLTRNNQIEDPLGELRIVAGLVSEESEREARGTLATNLRQHLRQEVLSTLGEGVGCSRQGKAGSGKSHRGHGQHGQEKTQHFVVPFVFCRVGLDR